MSARCFGFIKILLGLSGTCPILAMLPDVVVRMKPAALSQSKSVATTSDDTEGFIELLARRAQFGSRKYSLDGNLVLSPDYDPFLCEHFNVIIDATEEGELKILKLPPYEMPGENNNTVMLVPRGECSFERKAYAAKKFYGAKAIMIYDRLGARYQWDIANERVVFPRSQFDYECGNGNIFMENLPLDPPAYDSMLLDPIMGMTTSTTTEAMGIMTVMNQNSLSTIVAEAENDGGNDVEINIESIGVCNLTDTALDPCESQLCLVTSHLENSTQYPVCCAWDLPMTMPSADDAKDMDTDDILAVWLTIRQSEQIFQSDLLSVETEVTIESLYSKSDFNITYIFMWLWGTLVMGAGAWYAAGEYRRFGANLAAYKASEVRNEPRNRDDDSDRNRNRHGRRRRSPDQLRGEADNDIEKGKKKKNKNKDTSNECRENNIQEAETDEVVFQMVNTKKKRNEQAKKKKTGKKKKDEVWSLHSIPPPPRKQKKKNSPRENTARTTMTRMESETTIPQTESETVIPPRESEGIKSMEMNIWHVLIFVVMASGTLILLFFFRIYKFFFVVYGLGCAGTVSKLIFKPLIGALIPKLGEVWVEELKKPVTCGLDGFTITCHLFAFGWAIIWIWYGMTHYQPQQNPFFWLTLNAFGAAACIYGACLLKLNSIKIATILLGAIFIYDIFFVFITPFLTGGASVMLKVAGATDNPSGEAFCYKYPDERQCHGIGFLPMLFLLPKINDYGNGSVILGLGDIFLPGFLIAFTARYDEAARLVNAHIPEETRIKAPSKWYHGFFFPMMIAYSLGLFCAYTAVLLMKQGQPALLYICPICLAATFIIGRKDIKDLWNGARVFKLADRLVKKTEREWGKARMKRFAEQRLLENSAQEQAEGSRLESDNEQSSSRILRAPVHKQIEDSRRSDTERTSNNTLKSSEQFPAEPATSSDLVQPESRDVCFGRKGHSGTKYFRKIVANVAADSDEENFTPELYKIIKMRLKGRRFFKMDDDIWRELTKKETKKEIRMAYVSIRRRNKNKS